MAVFRLLFLAACKRMDLAFFVRGVADGKADFSARHGSVTNGAGRVHAMIGQLKFYPACGGYPGVVRASLSDTTLPFCAAGGSESEQVRQRFQRGFKEIKSRRLPLRASTSTSQLIARSAGKMNSFQTFSAAQPGLQFIPYQPANIPKATKPIKAADSGIAHTKKSLAEPRKPSSTRIATTPPAMFSPSSCLQPKNRPASEGQPDNPAGDNEDPLRGLFSDDEEPAINQGWDDTTCHQSYEVPETQGVHIEDSQGPPGPNADSGDDDKSSSQGPNHCILVAPGSSQSTRDLSPDPGSAEPSEDRHPVNLHPVNLHRGPSGISQYSDPNVGPLNWDGGVKGSPSREGDPGVEMVRAGDTHDSPILILDDEPCLSGRNSSIQEDSSQPGTASGDVSAPPGAIEQPEISSHCVFKKECESDSGRANIPSKRRRPYQQEDTLDVIEVVDMTTVPKTTPRRPRKRSKIMPQSSPVKRKSRRAPADQVTRRWEYKALIDYELRNGEPWVRVAWHSTWEPGKEFPRHQVEEAGRLQLKGEGGAKIANRPRQARKQQ